MNKSKPLCLIGARAGSKGIPNKNIKKFNGIPLIGYTIQNAIKSGIFSNVIISTEDEKIAEIAKKYGAEIPFLRPKKLATDSASMIDVMIHAIKKLRELNYNFDTLVNLDCTVPLLQNSEIKGAINLLKSSECDCVCLAYNQHHNPYYSIFEKNSKGFLEISKKLKTVILSRQKAPMVYQAIGVYAIDVEKFLKNKKLFASKTLPYLIPIEHGVTIDTKLEFQIAECIAKKIIKI